MLAQNPPDGAITGQVLDVSAMKKPTSGGSRDTDVKEPTATPTGSPPTMPATITTPVGRRPMTLRQSVDEVGSAGGPSTRLGEACIGRSPLEREDLVAERVGDGAVGHQVGQRAVRASRIEVVAPLKVHSRPDSRTTTKIAKTSSK